ncbi:hypothetical protein CB1_001390029 [Camelus ferus]|nr:hypothetical protein CB1_001390029 [Camelus ferus]
MSSSLHYLSREPSPLRPRDNGLSPPDRTRRQRILPDTLPPRLAHSPAGARHKERGQNGKVKKGKDGYAKGDLLNSIKLDNSMSPRETEALRAIKWPKVNMGPCGDHTVTQGQGSRVQIAQYVTLPGAGQLTPSPGPYLDMGRSAEKNPVAEATGPTRPGEERGRHAPWKQHQRLVSISRVGLQEAASGRNPAGAGAGAGPHGQLQLCSRSLGVAKVQMEDDSDTDDNLSDPDAQKISRQKHRDSTLTHEPVSYHHALFSSGSPLPNPERHFTNSHYFQKKGIHRSPLYSSLLNQGKELEGLEERIWSILQQTRVPEVLAEHTELRFQDCVGLNCPYLTTWNIRTLLLPEELFKVWAFILKKKRDKLVHNHIQFMFDIV